MASKVSIEDIIGRFNALDIKIRLGVFAGVLLLIVAIDYFAIMQFEIKTLSGMTAGIKKADDDIAKLEADQARLGSIKSSLVKLKEDFNKIQSKVRPVQELSLVVDDISKVAAAAQLTIDQITPSREGQEDFTTVGGVKYFAVPVVIMAHCAYHNFGQFLSALEASNIMFLVKDLRMEGSDKQNAPIAVTATLKVIVAEKPLEAVK